MEAVSKKIIQILPQKKINIFGQDGLMNNTIPYYLLTAIMVTAILDTIDVGFFFIFLIYTVLPLLDQFFQLDLRNPSESERKRLQSMDPYFRLALYATIIADWILFFKTMNTFATLEFTFIDCFKLIGLMFIFSNLNAVQFAVAHQIFHKKGPLDKYIGTFHMVKNLYMHFTYEHLYGHHRKVATPEDPASAEKGINVYKFFVRSFFGSYKSVYNMEKAEKKPFIGNYCVLSILASILFTLLIFKIYGMQAGILFLIEAFGSIFYLQAINYIEHYGLRRQQKADGTYEKVTIRHSWNAPHRFTNYLLFKLQRHSDHHENSLKPYQTLLSLEDSPHLPHGYSVCIFMSFFPKTWFSVMDPLVDEYKKTKKGDINGKVMKNAVYLTKVFIIKMALITTSLFIISATIN